MANIKLPGYRSIIPNEVFGRKASPLEDEVGKEFPATRLARITRFKIPNQDEVSNFIISNAKAISHASHEEYPETSSFIARCLRSFPNSIIEDIAKKKEEVLEHLMAHSLDCKLLSGRYYIEAASGIVPNQSLNDTELLEKGSEFYEKAIEKDPRRGVLRFRLQENGALPEISELEYLLDRGVRDSDVFFTGGKAFEDYQTVIDQTKLLYKALRSPEIINQIKDSSHIILEYHANLEVMETARCIADNIADKLVKQSGYKGIAGEITQLFRKIGEQETPGNIFYNRDPSLN